MRLQFQTVDVFTSDRFAGNPLVVVLNADGLSAAQMQAIAAEFNLAETTFIRPPRDAAHTAEVRIFTPRSEMPFAGHPNVGTAFVLARAGSSYGRPVDGEHVVFEEKAGLVPIEILRDGATVTGGRGRTRGIGLRNFVRRYRDCQSSPVYCVLRRTVHSGRAEKPRRARRGKPERRCVPARGDKTSGRQHHDLCKG
jgi:hypothetical protein